IARGVRCGDSSEYDRHVAVPARGRRHGGAIDARDSYPWRGRDPQNGMALAKLGYDVVLAPARDTISTWRRLDQRWRNVAQTDAENCGPNHSCRVGDFPTCKRRPNPNRK